MRILELRDRSNDIAAGGPLSRRADAFFEHWPVRPGLDGDPGPPRQGSIRLPRGSCADRGIGGAIGDRGRRLAAGTPAWPGRARQDIARPVAGSHR